MRWAGFYITIFDTQDIGYVLDIKIKVVFASIFYYICHGIKNI